MLLSVPKKDVEKQKAAYQKKRQRVRGNRYFLRLTRAIDLY